jgi:hypothetical protein
MTAYYYVRFSPPCLRARGRAGGRAGAAGFAYTPCREFLMCSMPGGGAGRLYSTLIPASLMSFAYFAVSDFMKETNCSGVL